MSQEEQLRSFAEREFDSLNRFLEEEAATFLALDERWSPVSVDEEHGITVRSLQLPSSKYQYVRSDYSLRKPSREVTYPMDAFNAIFAPPREDSSTDPSFEAFNREQSEDNASMEMETIHCFFDRRLTTIRQRMEFPIPFCSTREFIIASTAQFFSRDGLEAISPQEAQEANPTDISRIVSVARTVSDADALLLSGPRERKIVRGSNLMLCQIVPSSDHEGVEVTQIVFTDPAGWIPAWMINLGQARFMGSVIVGLQAKFAGVFSEGEE